MAEMDIFHQDPFTMIEMTQAIERVPYQPTLLGEMGIFTPTPIRTKAAAVEVRDGALVLIQTSQRGQPVNSERITEKRNLRYFEVPRIVQGDTITADEIAGIRAFGQETELMQVMEETARRLSGPTGLVANVGYTKENMRLAAIQGQVVDADSSVIYNWYDEFGFAAPAEVAFNLAAQAANTLRPIVNGIVRAMYRAAKGAFPPGTRIGALCGDLFYDEFVNHVDVIRTYTNWEAAQALRDGSQGGAFDNYTFADVEWINYRGSDDTSTIAIGADKVKFFPLNAPGVFAEINAPLESFQFVNTPGKDMYVLPIFDKDRDMWWRQEVYSYPLMICKRPEVLQSGRAGA